jgi:spermidine synthase
VYHFIGLLTAGFMAGLSLGGWLTARRGGQPEASHRWQQDKRWLLGLEAALLSFWLALTVLLPLLHRGVREAATLAAVVGPTLLLLNGLAGFLVGAQFPVANRVVRRQRIGRSDSAALLYALDLLGAFAAALLVSVALLPALGIVQTCLLVAGLKACSLALLLAMRWPAREEETAHPPRG